MQRCPSLLMQVALLLMFLVRKQINTNKHPYLLLHGE